MESKQNKTKNKVQIQIEEKILITLEKLNVSISWLYVCLMPVHHNSQRKLIEIEERK